MSAAFDSLSQTDHGLASDAGTDVVIAQDVFESRVEAGTGHHGGLCSHAKNVAPRKARQVSGYPCRWRSLEIPDKFRQSKRLVIDRRGEAVANVQLQRD
jgi:hypothetical protein